MSHIPKERLNDLFKEQIKRLEECCGKMPQAVEILKSKKKQVLEKAESINMGFAHVPFLPVVSENYYSIYEWMRQIFFKNQWGYVLPTYVEVFHSFEIPVEPYYIFDVETGSALINRSPLGLENLLEEHGRRFLLITEAIAIAFHDRNILERHSLAAAGCYTKDVNFRCVPIIHVRKDNVATIDWGVKTAEVVSTYKNIGLPSCSK
ncbi:MAG: DUF5701 family protein [Candidatus Pacebacteria bacterium]|nr:DUF5701 family protein [Candidatus Paceibacterota bacterium]